MSVRFHCLLLVAFLMLLLPALAQSQEWVWRQYYDAGKAQLDKGKYTDAEAPLKKAVDLSANYGSVDPRFTDSCCLLAQAYTGEERYPDARSSF